MSELLAVLSNPKRRRGRRGRRRNPFGRFQRVQQLSARRQRRRGSLMQSVHRVGGSAVSRQAWRSSGYRRNPRQGVFAGFGKGRAIAAGLGQELVAAAIGAAGGAAVDLIMRPLPLALKAGPLNYLVRGAASIGLGLVGQVVKIPGAAEAARGAMTITVYNALRQYVLVPRGLGELSEDDVAALSEAALEPEPGMSEVIDMPAISQQMGEVIDGLGEQVFDGQQELEALGASYEE